MVDTKKLYTIAGYTHFGIAILFLFLGIAVKRATTIIVEAWKTRAAITNMPTGADSAITGALWGLVILSITGLMLIISGYGLVTQKRWAKKASLMSSLLLFFVGLVAILPPFFKIYFIKIPHSIYMSTLTDVVYTLPLIRLIPNIMLMRWLPIIPLFIIVLTFGFGTATIILLKRYPFTDKPDSKTETPLTRSNY